MQIVVIIVMSAIAIGISIARISALRKRNSAEREATQASREAAHEQTETPKEAEAVNEVKAVREVKETFADYLDAENAPTLTRAELDEWRRDFALARRYGRRPPKSKAPFANYLREKNFSLAGKSTALEYEHAAQINEKKLPPQSVLPLGGKEKYREYIKGEETSTMR
ncbi:MAG: hypothetical protein K2M95_07875 [Clostridiales bacterium]|nr:hypothetical protein [Clostridiales bacterium]